MPPPPRKRGTLTREEILRAAWEIIDEEGVERVTMASVARRVGVTPMSLYAHVGSKAELLTALDRRDAEPEPPPPAREARELDEWLFHVFSERRAKALAHPALSLRTTMAYMTNEVPGPVGLRSGAAVLDGLAAAGVPQEHLAVVYVTINTFLNGFVLWEINRFHTQTMDDYRRSFFREIAELDEPPGEAIMSLFHTVTDRGVDELFTRGLRAVIQGALAAAAHHDGD